MMSLHVMWMCTVKFNRYVFCGIGYFYPWKSNLLGIINSSVWQTGDPFVRWLTVLVCFTLLYRKCGFLCHLIVLQTCTVERERGIPCRSLNYYNNHHQRLHFSYQTCHNTHSDQAWKTTQPMRYIVIAIFKKIQQLQ